MPIPRYDEIQYPLLRQLADGVVVRKADLEQPLGDHFGLTDTERSEECPSKNGTWAEREKLLPDFHNAPATGEGGSACPTT